MLATSAEYYYKVVHKGDYLPGQKDTPAVIEHVKATAHELMSIAKQATDVSEIDNWVAAHGDLLASRPS